jgi:PEGA domain-containing protein/copper amine oxidase-like protein
MPRAPLFLSFVMAAVFGAAAMSSAASAPAKPQPVPTFPPHGGAYLTSLPANASAWLDGVYVGSTPVYVDDVLPGHHTVTLSASGWQPQTAQFDVAVGRIEPVSIVMQRNPGDNTSKGQGALAVAGAPAGSHVFLDGAPLDTPSMPHPTGAGYHIVTLQPPDSKTSRSMRIVDVFPGATTTISFAPPSNTSVVPEDDVLEPVDAAVPGAAIAMAGSDVIIHFKGVEVECTIGSRAYTFNGKQATMSISPALVGGKVYLPRSLLVRIGGPSTAPASSTAEHHGR